MFKNLTIPGFKRGSRSALKLDAGSMEASSQGRGGAYFESHDERTALAYGLAWHPLDGLGSQEVQAKKLATKAGASRYTIVRPSKSGIEPEVGLLSRTSKVPKHKVIEAAAAVFALAIKENTALYLAPGPEPGTYLLLGLLSGMPSPEFDIVGSASDVLSAGDHYQTYLTEGSTLYVHEALAGAEEGGLVDPGIEEFIHRNAVVVRWVPSIPYECTAGKHSGGTLVAVGSSQMVVLGGLIFLAIAGLVAAVMFYQDWSSKNSELAKAKALNAAALASYTNSRDTAFGSAGVELATPATRAIWADVQRQPTSRNGWRITSITCENGSCTAEFTRTRASTFRTFSDSIKDGESPSMALSKLATAIITYAVPNWQAAPQLQLQDVNVPDVTVPLGTEAQRMVLAGLSVTLSPTAPLGDSGLVTRRKIAVQKYGVGTWEIKGPADTLLEAIASLPIHSTLSALKFNIVENEVTYVATGRYFVSAK